MQPVSEIVGIGNSERNSSMFWYVFVENNTHLCHSSFTVTTLLFASSKENGPIIPPNLKVQQTVHFCENNGFSDNSKIVVSPETTILFI